MRIVLCYDISEQSRRTRLSRFLARRLERVQRSTFEGNVGGEDLDWIRRAAAEIIDPRTDSVRIYFSCGACHPRTEIIGTGAYVEPVGEADLLF